MKATGTFDVNLKPLDPYSQGEHDVKLGRMSIDKTFHGDIDATSIGEMLSVMTPVSGSAGYVAIEQVTGILAGKRGSFVIQHSNTMASGESHQHLEVVPDSGTAELTGLRGRMIIRIEDGNHFYELDYDLPA